MDGAKCGKWASLRAALSLHPSSWTMKVLAQNGRTMKAATEDIMKRISDDSFASLIRSAKDELDLSLEQLLNSADSSALNASIRNEKTAPPKQHKHPSASASN